MVLIWDIGDRHNGHILKHEAHAEHDIKWPQSSRIQSISFLEHIRQRLLSAVALFEVGLWLTIEDGYWEAKNETYIED
jgi:hypothetical protein